MWLKKLVAVSMIITLVGMNGIAIAGILAPAKKGAEITASQVVPPPMPTLTISIEPTEIATGSFGTIKWSASGAIEKCRGEGNWDGQKTAFGSQSTGRLTKEGKVDYTLICTSGNLEVRQTASAVVKAGAVVSNTSKPTSGASQGAAASQAPTYCNGVTPCYGPREVAQHGSAGNCWGYNGNRVMNISGFDSAFHQVKSGISSIEVGGVCGTNLAGALGGSVGAEGQTRNHTGASKANADRNMIPYFIGYFDANKP